MSCGAHGHCRRNNNVVKSHRLPRLLLQCFHARLLPGRTVVWSESTILPRTLPLRQLCRSRHGPRRALAPAYHAPPLLPESRVSSFPTYLQPLHRKPAPRRSLSPLSQGCPSQYRPQRHSRNPARPSTHPLPGPFRKQCLRRIPSTSTMCLHHSPPGSRAVRSRLAGWLSSTRCRGLRLRNRCSWTRRAAGAIAVGA